MTTDRIAEWIRRGESLSIEFKASASDADLVEAVVCMANASGGVILLGVRDDGAIVGAQPRHGQTTDPDRLDALIANRTSPPVAVRTHVVSSDGGQVVAVEVPRASSVVCTSEGKYLRRALEVHGRPRCLPMAPADVLARSAALGSVDVSARPLAGAGFSDLDSTELARFRELAGTAGDLVLSDLADMDLVSALGLVDPDGRLRAAAVLLFGRADAIARLVPTHEVVFQVLESQGVRVNRVERIPLVKALQDLYGAIDAYNPEEEIEVGLLRVGIPSFSPVALRELLANALVHRDYALNGQLLVQIEDGTLSITNPGGLPEGITVDNIHVAPARPRNPLLADVFKRAGLVERTGRGVGRVFREQLAIGRTAPDYRRSTSSWVQVRLHPGLADRELAVFVAEWQRDGHPLRLTDLMVIHEVRRERRIASARAAELLQVGINEARTALNDLVERGVLESRGERKGRTYHLSAALYRRLGERSGYVRTRGFDAIQQEQMVLTFVRRHGSISRAEAAELCQVTPGSASALLRRMRQAGRLEMLGVRRAARYFQPESGP